MSTAAHSPLLRLARLCGVQPVYIDAEGRRQDASPETLLALLKALGAPLARPEDAESAVRERRLALWRRPLEPVMVAWGDRPVYLTMRLPDAQFAGHLAWIIKPESGEPWLGSCRLTDFPPVRHVHLEGQAFTVCRLPLPTPSAPGYYRVEVILGEQVHRTLLIVAPPRAYASGEGHARTNWGAFLPLYALHSARSWGVGDLTDLRDFIDWTAERGGRVAGTLPLLAAFLGGGGGQNEPFEPSPYSPASRLFWNEIYIDVERAPNLSDCPEAQALLASDVTRDELARLRAGRLVDYRRVMALKRRFLNLLARQFFGAGMPAEIEAGARGEFARHLASQPNLEDYARFRAATERQGASWFCWPEAMRKGQLRPGDFDPESWRSHLYAQWLVDRQVNELTDSARGRDVAFYVDMPLGVNSDSYDVWRWRDQFALDASGGAPPDGFFSRGQCWGFPPLHPGQIREDGYRYVIASLRQLLRPADVLRIDHVMGLHRLFWVPNGMEATKGAYVRYPAEELYAILCLESHRHHTVLVGEDLGTVPDRVRLAMDRHGFHRMYVAQFSVWADARQPLAPVAAGHLASLNTHDVSTFAGFWHGRDLELRVELGLMSAEQLAHERNGREMIKSALIEYMRNHGLLNGEAALNSVLAGCLKYLCASPASIVMINVEDLWLEEEPQNVPGTTSERPNWRRRAALTFDQMRESAEVNAILRAVQQAIESNTGEKLDHA